MTAVNIGLSGEWQGRAYLFDIAEAGELERSLHFLVHLGKRVTPLAFNEETDA